LDLDYTQRLLGVEIPKVEIKKILKRLGFTVAEVGPRQIEVKVPTFRLDISIPEDLIEEIGRIYDYQKIPSVFPVANLIPPNRNLDIFWEDRIRDVLKAAGFSEVYNYSFISEKDVQLFPLSTSLGCLELKNPTSLDFKYLRPSLIPNLLKNTEKNQPNFGEIRIFELGKIFRKIKNKLEEKRALTGLITGEAFYQLKGVVDLLLQKLGISNVWYDSYEPTPEESQFSIWHPKKCAEVKINQEEVGFLGEISPKILENLKIKSRVVIFDIDFEKLARLASEEHEFRPISKFPAAVRDIAVLVPVQVRVEEVLNKIEAAGSQFLIDVDLFDIYEGEEIPEGKKNLAFHIVYQAEDRTLSSKEIDETHQKIIKALEENLERQVRKRKP